MKIYCFYILFGFLLLFPATLPAQQQVITGKTLLGKASEESTPLPYANISVLKLPDSSFVKGAASDTNGHFRIAYLRRKQARYLLKASYTGCTPVYQLLSADADTLRLGTLMLEENALELQDIVVTAPVQAVEQKGDTTVYHASAFPTPEGAYLEELVKRIPGLNYDPETMEMTYNGYAINEITVNGKDFFKGNRKVALENLPANFIEKLHVYDKPTDEEKMTGVRSGKKNYVLDLQTKKELNGTLTGMAEAGYGTHKRRDLNGRLIRFEEKGDNLMLVGQSTNRYFTSPYEKNIQNSAGADVTHVFRKGLEISGSINYNYTRSGNEASGYNEQYLQEGNQYGASESNGTGKSRNLQAHTSLRWEIDKKTSLFFSASLSKNTSNHDNRSRNATFDNPPEVDVRQPFDRFEETDPAIRINENNQQSLSTSKNNAYAVQASLVRRLNKKGNSLSLNVNSNLGNSETENFTLATTRYYRMTNTQGGDSILFRNQFNTAPGRTGRHSLRLAYTQVLAKKTRLQVAYNLNMETEKLDGNTYALDRLATPDAPIGTLPPGYETENIDSLTTRSNSKNIGHSLSLLLSYNGEVWGIQTSVELTPQRRTVEKSTGIHQADTTTHFTEWSPQFILSYRKGDNYAMLNYNGNSSQPSLTDLISPTDYSSPLNIRRSNPNLRPSYRHSMNLMFFNFRKGISASAMLTQEFNTITQATIYHTETGGQETFPVNINGNRSASGNISYDKRIKQFRLNVGANGSFNRSVGLINGSTDASHITRSVTHNTALNGNLRLYYLPAWGSLSLNGQWNFDRSSNSLQDIRTYTRTYRTGLEGSFNLPCHFVLETDAAYRFRNGTGIAGNDDNEVLWNLKLSWKFLKSRKAEVSVYWADILSQRKSYNRTATTSGLYERYEEQLRGYILFALKYRFDSMN